MTYPLLYLSIYILGSLVFTALMGKAVGKLPPRKDPPKEEEEYTLQGLVLVVIGWPLAAAFIPYFYAYHLGTRFHKPKDPLSEVKP